MKAQQNRQDKDTWHSRKYSLPQVKPKILKSGLTAEQEIQIGLDMIPMFKAKEEEAQQQYDRIIEVKQELNALKADLGILSA